MANYNIQMNMLNSSGTYDILYPQTLGSQVSGSVANASNADYATTASTLSSTLSVSKGGTGVTSYSSLASQLQGYLDSGMTESEVETLIGKKSLSKFSMNPLAISTSFISLPMGLTFIDCCFLSFSVSPSVSVIISRTSDTSITREYYISSGGVIFIENERNNGVFALLNPDYTSTTVEYLTDFYITNNSKIKTTNGTATLQINYYH